MKAKRLIPLLMIAALGFVTVKLTFDALKRAEAVSIKSRPVAVDRSLREPGDAAPADTLPALAGLRFAGSPGGDFDGNGYVDLTDFEVFSICFTVSGPEATLSVPACLIPFDFDDDNDVDLADFAAFTAALGHLPIPLRDTLGNVITITSSTPYSPRQTCGTCHEHEADEVANGEWFQQGRTDLAGNVDMRDDYYGDGRFWIKSAGRYGKWGQSFQYLLAAKNNTHASQIDQTAFMWVQECGGCHSGGGPGERDRDDQLFYNELTGQFGYELLGKTPAEVAFDGDYTVLNRATGTLSFAPWDQTGLSEPDCLLCHRDQRPTVNGRDMVQPWRSGVLAAGVNLVDGVGNPVPAFAAASTAGQGWFSQMTRATGPVFTDPSGLSPADQAWVHGNDHAATGRATTTLQIDYGVGVTDGSLLVNAKDEVLLAPSALAQRTLDVACVSCHPIKVVTGDVWYDQRDIHYRKFNNLNDDDPLNDIPPERSAVCVECHPAGLDHNAAKGNSFQLKYRDELDYVNFRTCRDCHLNVLPDGSPNPNKHPDAPDVPGTVAVHQIGFYEGDYGPMRSVSCQGCHIPYALTAGLFFRDITVPGNVAWTDQYLSADPLDPTDPDRSRWYPPLLWKQDSDGVERLFPASVWINIYFGDWDQMGTPEDLSDDIIAPIATWRVAQAVGSSPLPGTTDDDGDGRIEIDRPEELLAYFAALKGNDSNGVPIAANPVLLRGPRVWHEDGSAPSGVNYFEHEGTGNPVTSYPYIWGMDHNVLPQEEAWGAGVAPQACDVCHTGDGDSPVFDRLVLVDPHGLDGKPEYTTVREQTAVTFHKHVVLKDSLGNPLTAGSTEPYSGRQTCGGVGCHDVDRIANGFIHQQGRTDPDGNIVMQDDALGDGRWWVRSAGMYGRWSGGGGGLNRQTAGKHNANESEMDLTAFSWASNCGACHAGGGVAEFDRDGERLWDVATGQFGYEALGQNAGDVTLDGDYAVIDTADGSLSAAPWDVTGVAGPECLHCHRADRLWLNNEDMHRKWRADVLATTTSLVDNLGDPVPAFAAAGTAGQGWFSILDTQAHPPVLQIDYNVGINAGELLVGADKELMLAPDFLASVPTDRSCWGCHLAGGFQNKRGTVWFDERDVHFKGLNDRNDEDPSNNVSDDRSTACNECHPGDLDHDFAKGGSPYAQFRNELDWVDFRSCRECHLTTFPDGSPNPDKHPDAPDVPGNVTVHLTGFFAGESGPMASLSCQACHVPYPLERGIIVTDRSLTGGDTFYFTDELLSANPLDPADPDKSKWYPGLYPKVDSDGVVRHFPQKQEVIIYWADWDRNGTPENPADDTVRPIILWRLQNLFGDEPLPVVTDDNGDGKLEINRPEEMLAYMTALQGVDAYGRQIAANPVLVKGPTVWYADPQAGEGVNSFDAAASGATIQSFEIFGLDHNVLVAEESWGYADNPIDGCGQCHRPITFDSPVFDRKILVDPFDLNGQPVYRTVRAQTGLNPP